MVSPLKSCVGWTLWFATIVACDGARAPGREVTFGAAGGVPVPAPAVPAPQVLAARQLSTSEDPGREPWRPVPPDRVRDECRLDPAALAAADAKLGVPWVAVRYGKLCHSYKADGAPQEALSSTKVLGATIAGAVAYQSRDLPRRGRKTGPFSDGDRVDHWLDRIAYNEDAHVAHVLAMVAQSRELSPGRLAMEYDYFGNVQLDSIAAMLNAAIAQDPQRMGVNLDAFAQHHFFVPLGMRQSSWWNGYPDKALAWGWTTTPLDMARLGLLLLRDGVWSGTRLLDSAWVYRTTHPAFEDANTGFGYCTWLNASSNWTLGGQPVPARWHDVGEAPRYPGPCAPVSVYHSHPHGLSESSDCNYAAPYTCEQEYDAGVWQSVGGFGKVIQGHPGLDLVLVVWDLTPTDFSAIPAPGLLWDAVRPAVVAADPRFAGDEPGFCAAYGANRYAPDLAGFGNALP